MTLGERIRKCRRELNLSQETLGDIINVHENTIRKWEKGVSTPNAIELKNIAEALKTTTGYLCAETDTSSGDKAFLKNSAYQDMTEIHNSVPSMAYWGSLVDNAEKTAENGKNIEIIIGLVKTALRVLETSIEKKEEKNSEPPEEFVYAGGKLLATELGL